MTLLTEDQGTKASATDAGAAATGAAADNGGATAAAAPADASADVQRKTLTDAGMKAEDLAKLDEAGLKKAFDEHTAKVKAEADKTKAGAPEKYEAFKMPEGVTLEGEALTALQTLGKELNLTQEAAQKIADLGAKQAQAFATAGDKQFKAQVAQWVEQAKADKEIGGAAFDANLAIAKEGLKKFASPAFMELVAKSGLGNHPEFIRLMYAVGKEFKAAQTHTGREKGADKDARSFYNNSQMNP